ncbi:hypothetical protein NDU88_006352 [Pleurodeles waltl]|uniref:Uncharacterized protein n=1 Tax=Pleurodeles waltl TaxID=8319 RepID=A0AAV7LQ97_PLEWA|nr:hypothetical protein NDU88_006352 [Pleurodeles waltl]
MNELGDRVDILERTGETQGEELDAHWRKILELHKKKCRTPFKKTLKTSLGEPTLELKESRYKQPEGIWKITEQIVPPYCTGPRTKESILDRVHRTRRPAASLGQPQDILTYIHYYRQKEIIMAAARDRNHIDFEGNKIWLYSRP